MLYAYMRSLHGHHTNWSKVILHNLKTEIGVLQKRARTPDNSKSISIVSAPFTDPIDDLRVIRDKCTLTDKIPMAEPVNGAPSPNAAGQTPTTLAARKRPHGSPDILPTRVSCDVVVNLDDARTIRTRITAKKPKVSDGQACPRTSARPQFPTDGVRIMEPSTPAPPLVAQVEDTTFQDFGQEMEVTLASLVSRELEVSFRTCFSKAKLATSLRLTQKLRESERMRAGLNDRVAELKAELDNHISQIDRYKEEFHAEMTNAVELEEQLNVVKNQVENHKFTAKRADKTHTTLRVEFNQVNTELRMLKVSGK
ncbi:hypothetical protein R1sor_004520 [Riccia sorocarpa]|uniref:Uncharacterized protein n=1 Tax=Riccia sorocarpa TaxID=122646 RepID=A0ABD3HKE8_9MARC